MPFIIFNWHKFSAYNTRITYTTYTCQKSIRSININYQNASTSGIHIRYNIGKKCSRNTLSKHFSLASDNVGQRLTVSVLTTHVSNTSQRCCRVFFVFSKFYSPQKVRIRDFLRNVTNRFPRMYHSAQWSFLGKFCIKNRPLHVDTEQLPAVGPRKSTT